MVLVSGTKFGASITKIGIDISPKGEKNVSTLEMMVRTYDTMGKWKRIN